MMTPAEDFLSALLRGDRRGANQLVDAALDSNPDLRSLYLDILQPAMREVGRLWQENGISVADEHLATAIAQAAMGRAFERSYVWHDRRTPTLIAACAEDERHQMGLRMLCDLLELEGWDTTYLGASVPVESLVAIVVKRKPDVVAVSATIAPHLPRVRSAVGAIRGSGLSPMPLIIIGGLAVGGDEELARRLGADLTASDASEAVRVLRDQFAQR